MKNNKDGWTFNSIKVWIDECFAARDKALELQVSNLAKSHRMLVALFAIAVMMVSAVLAWMALK